MQITINLPDDIGRQIQQLPDAGGHIQKEIYNDNNRDHFRSCH